MKKTVALLLFFVGLVPLHIYSQCGKNYCSPNLVPNGDFEICRLDTNSNCVGHNSVEMGITCSSVEGWYSTGDKTTPDYFGGSCNGNNAGTNICGSGNLIGFFTSTGTNRRENVQCQLSQQLVAGKRYCVEFKVRNPGVFSSTTCDGLGVCFTPNRVNSDTLATAVTAGGFLGYDYTPQVENPAGNIISSCQTFSQSFIATGNEKWMVIGNFKTDAQTQFQPAPGKTYVFIDDVSVREVSDNCNKPTVTTTSSTICAATCGILTATGNGGKAPYSYSWNPGALSGSAVNVCPAITTTYTVIISDSTGTTASGTAAVTVSSTPIADFSISPTGIIAPNTTVMFADNSGNPGTPSWNFGDPLSGINNTSGLYSPTHSYINEGDYCITLISTAGSCADTATKCITVIGEAFILFPNVFTPNGDGDNDIFYFETKGIKELTCSIYDRWGLKMGEWNTVSGGWNGRIGSGAIASDGVYYYIMKAVPFNDAANVIEKQGFLQLLHED